MNKQTAHAIIIKINKTCSITKENLILKKQSDNNWEIQTGKILQEKEWLCLEEIISNYGLRMKLVNNLIKIY